MIKTTLSEETSAQFALSDDQLVGFSWLEEGRDLRFHLLSGGGQPATLTCVWATGVNIDLKYDSKSSGLALSWECRFKKTGKVWCMVFEFPPQGAVELTCNEAHLEYEGAV